MNGFTKSVMRNSRTLENKGKQRMNRDKLIDEQVDGYTFLGVVGAFICVVAIFGSCYGIVRFFAGE